MKNIFFGHKRVKPYPIDFEAQRTSRKCVRTVSDCYRRCSTVLFISRKQMLS